MIYDEGNMFTITTMPKSCAVYQCSATSEHENRSFHQFPMDPKLRRAWIARIHKEGYNPSASLHLGSFHFSEEDFNKGSFNITPQEFKKRTPKKGSIPSWNLMGIEGDQQWLLKEQDVQKPKVALPNLLRKHLFRVNGFQCK